jgi:tetratricopeptide (TPR) repeat protein
MNEAIEAYRQALTLDPKRTSARQELAKVLDKTGDLVAALDQYGQAMLADSNPDTKRQYLGAQQRLENYIASLKASGKSEEAAKLETSMRALQSGPRTSDKLQAAMLAGTKALSERRFDEAERAYKEAVELAEKIEPHDQRLVESYWHLGDAYAWRQDFRNADIAYHKELSTAERLYGPQSPRLADPFTHVALLAGAQKDYSTATSFLTRAIEVNEKTYGENNKMVAEALRNMAGLYLLQSNYEQAENYLLRAETIYESLYGQDAIDVALPLSSLCYVYDKWGKPEKSETCQRHLLTVLEKQYGANSPFLANTLTSEAQALRKLGRAREAEQMEQRLKTIQVAANPK